jgi:hypothetical protein
MTFNSSFPAFHPRLAPLLYGLPASHLHILQGLLNAALRLATKKIKFDDLQNSTAQYGWHHFRKFVFDCNGLFTALYNKVRVELSDLGLTICSNSYPLIVATKILLRKEICHYLLCFILANLK